MNTQARLRLVLVTFLMLNLTACDFFSKEKAQPIASMYADLMLINCQDKASSDDARIAGSVNVTQEDYQSKTKDWNKSNPVIVYCANYLCTASDHLAQTLVKDGFQDVLVYHGGIQEWYQLSLKDPVMYPIEGALTQPWLKNKIQEVASEPSEIKAIDAQQLAQKLAQAKKK